jgi:alkyldihydroxyacetonephosphate synthase
VYRSGVCFYFYYGIRQCEDQLKLFEEISTQIKETVINMGGSLSHHHGIGKRESKTYGKVTSNVTKEILKGLKTKIDPKNVFAAGNLIFQQIYPANL